MKDKKTLEKYEAIRFIGPVLMHNLESGMLFDGKPKKAVVEDVNGTRICISFDPSAFEKSGNTVIGYIDRRQVTHRIRPRPAKEERERKQHWINACNSSGCEIQLFNQRYTIWLSNKDWKQAERDGEFLVRALESAAALGLPAKGQP